MRRNPLHRVLRSMGPAGAPVGSVVRVRTDEASVVLTFDDGPRPGSTEAVLEALAAAQATATFFVLAGRVRRAPELVARIVAEGHEIGLHGQDHRPFPDFGRADLLQRTRDSVHVLEDASGRPVRWVRPPYGRQTVGTWLALRSVGLTPVLWSATLWDSRDIPDSDRLARATRGVGAGDVLLAHDSFADHTDGADDGPEPRVDRGALVTGLLEAYRSAGLAGVSLEHALRRGEPVRRAWFSS